MTWHDGQPVSSADVQYTWQAIMQPDHNVATRYGYDRIDAVDTPDPHAMCHDQGAATCKQTGLCAVDGTCAVYPAGTVCGQTGCDDAGKMVIPDGTCNGTGMCESPAHIKCEDGTTCVAGVCTEAQPPKP